MKWRDVGKICEIRIQNKAETRYIVSTYCWQPSAGEKIDVV